MLDTKLIERALQLTSKTIEDMFWWMTGWYENEYWDLPFEDKFSMAQFCYYLISEDFIDQYQKFDSHNLNPEMDFLYAIRDYQKGNEEPLISLLSKI